MSVLEAHSIELGSVVSKAVCGRWLGDLGFVPAAETSLIDSVTPLLTSFVDRRRFNRFWEETAELIADRVKRLVETEFRDLPANERQAALVAARETFDAALPTEAVLFQRDLDADQLQRLLRSEDPDRVALAGLNHGGENLYDMLLRECSQYTIEITRVLPGDPAAAPLAEILSRNLQIQDRLATVLSRLPTRRVVADFELDYRQLLSRRLDRLELFGAGLSGTSPRYPLSVSYVEPKVGLPTRSSGGPPDPSVGLISDVLAGSRRLLVRGPAGAGKTTLLQWIAVQSARDSFSGGIAGWNDTVPFLVPVRRFAESELPTPDRFVQEAGWHIADEMPSGWVHEQLRIGRALVLVDGIDELPEGRRSDARAWIRDLTDVFPMARYVVTARPSAVPFDWLASEQFDVAELEFMDETDVPVLVHRWHEAMRSTAADATERETLVDYEERLLATLDGNHHLYQLATSPLLCALLCALHRDRRAQLPANRMELYEVAIDMLVDRRDVERRIESSPALSRTEKVLLLQDIAYWLIRNDLSDAAHDRVIARLRTRLANMPRIAADADAVYRVLLERSGLLREPIPGRVDFLHRTFQEYLAAKQAADDGDLGLLVSYAHLDQWRDVVAMAAGHAAVPARTALIRDLLQRSDRRSTSRHDRDNLRSVAMSCLEVSAVVPADLEAAVRERADGVLPGEAGESDDPAGPPTSPEQTDQGEPGPGAVVLYSASDADLAGELAAQLEPLRDENVLSEIKACRLSSQDAEGWMRLLEPRGAARIAFLVVTPDLVSGDFPKGRELRLLVHRHHEHQVILLPVIFKTADWRKTRFGHLTPLPDQGRAVIDWEDRDAAYDSVIRSARLAVRTSANRSRDGENPAELKDVFKLSGAPAATFVEPACFAEFRASLHQPGLGVIVEGPSGVGKTTLLRRMVLTDEDLLGRTEFLSGRKPRHHARITELATGGGHDGVIVIDDFHHLPASLQELVAGYFILLADDESEAKLVLAGIPAPSEHLISVRADVATRTRFFRLAPATVDMIVRMIEKGEDSLNITFTKKDDIARAAGGSMSTAQALCWHLAVQAGISRTSPLAVTIHADFESACKRTTEALAVKYHGTVRRFAALDHVTETVCISLLLRLGQTLSGMLRLDDVIAENPDWQDAIERIFLDDAGGTPLFTDPEILANLYFDPGNRRLVAPDPQFLFYLRQFEREQLMEEAGKRVMQPRTRIFVCYSHADQVWLERLQVHLNPLERAGIVDLWSDQRIQVGDLWQKEITEALAAAKIALLLVSADMLASDFVRTQELPALLTAAEEGGCRVVPILVRPSIFADLPSVSRFQAANPPGVTLSEMSPEGADRALMRLTQSLLRIMDLNLS